MILDEEVFAVIMAVSIVASAIGIAVTLSPEIPEPFMALGLLNEECRMGDYPSTVTNNSIVDFCMFLANYMNKPVLYRLDYKISEDGQLPTNKTPLDLKPVMSWYGVLNNKQNTTKPIEVLIYSSSPRRIALVFELWVYDTNSRNWSYTGIWNHHYINVTPVIRP